MCPFVVILCCLFCIQGVYLTPVIRSHDHALEGTDHCWDNNPNTVMDPLCALAKATKRLVSFNTGLTPRVDRYDVRKEKLARALEETQADVICLQEVWFSSDMSRVLAELNLRYPYSYSHLHNSDGQMTSVSSIEAPCFSSSFLTIFMPCLAWHCSGATNGELDYLACAELNCSLFQHVDQACITCMVLSGIKHWQSSCVFNYGNKFNTPGLLLLSKRPLRNARVNRYMPGRKLLLPRAYIQTRIDDIGTVVCTHTTADLGPTYYEALPFKSWRLQNLAEARDLVSSLLSLPNVVVMGDINSGPEVVDHNVEADFEDSYEYMSHHGYSTPYVSRVGVCTWCVYNPLTKASHNRILDHVFMKNMTVVAARRVLDHDVDGHDFPLSDHYGIEVTVRTPGSY